MAMTGRSINSRVKVADTVAITREADNGLITPCVKEAVTVRIERAAADGLITPCVKEAGTITLALQGAVFIRGTPAGTKGEILFDNNSASDRPYWDQNSRDTYDPAPEVTASGRPLYYSGDFFLIA